MSIIDNNLISVIVPVYNAEKFLSESIRSVISQKYPYLEIIVIDDCSTDRSAIIVNDLMKDFSCIKYHKLNCNSGVGVARNKGLELANGRYIAFIDSDDVWVEDKLQKQMLLFKKHPHTVFTYTGIGIINESGDLLKEKCHVKVVATYKQLLRETMIATSTVIIDRQNVHNFCFPDRRSAEDYSLWLSLLKEYGPAYGINEALTLYRKTSSSVSANKIGEVKYFFSVQTEDLKIKKISACINTFFYIINAIKKHYL